MILTAAEKTWKHYCQESLEAVRSVEGDVKCVVVHAGRLFGAARGEEPVPFLTGPKAEPVLDESITRQAVLVGPGTVLSAVSPGSQPAPADNGDKGLAQSSASVARSRCCVVSRGVVWKCAECFFVP